jgi:hypothetical protein
MRALSLATLLMLGACQTDDFSRPGTWQPTGANDQNLRAMLAEPVHAARGVAAPDDRGSAGSAAIGRLHSDRRRPLPASGRGPNGASAAPQGGSDAR